VTVGAGETLRVRLTSPVANAANELFARFNDVPTGAVFNAASGGLDASPVAVVPSTSAGTYYVLVRGNYDPDPTQTLTLLAESLPFGITDVQVDRGGDSRYVSVSVRGARFSPNALVKLIRPGIAEFEPKRYEVVDATQIRAIFDLTGAPHGLYDVTVINP